MLHTKAGNRETGFAKHPPLHAKGVDVGSSRRSSGLREACLNWPSHPAQRDSDAVQVAAIFCCARLQLRGSAGFSPGFPVSEQGRSETREPRINGKITPDVPVAKESKLLAVGCQTAGSIPPLQIAVVD